MHFNFSPRRVCYKVENDDGKQSSDRGFDLLEARLVTLLVKLRIAQGTIDEQVSEEQENEGNNAGAEESCPVNVVGDVDRVQPDLICWLS